VNLFLLCHGRVAERGAAGAVGSVAAELPYLGSAAVERWHAPSGRAELAWIAHPPDRVGGVRYVETRPDTVALFAGRPAGGHDPRGALGAEGRCTAATYDDATGELELCSDRLGAYPVFVARGPDGVAFSNSAEVLRRLLGTAAVDRAVIASLIGGGWSLSGHPLWADVRRVPRGVRLRVTADGEQADELLPASAIAGWFAARDFDAEAAAAALVDSVRGLAGWPGRPDVVPVTGGRDSRVVLAAALRAGIDFRAVTVGGEAAPDVVIAQRLCGRAGIPHERLDEPPGGAFFDHRAAAERTAIIGGGAAVADAPGGIPRDAVRGPLDVWHSGQGGEIARGIYGHAAGADPLYRAFVARRPGRPELLSGAGAQLVRAEIERFTDEMVAAGVPPAEVPDAFYLLQRMGMWAALGHSAVEWVRDTTSPLWSTQVIPHMLAVPPDRRAREAFHLEVLRVLAPELVSVPFADRDGWLADQSPWAARRRRAASLAVKAGREARRRAQWARQRAWAATRRQDASGRGSGDARRADGANLSATSGAAVADPLTALMAELREWVLADHQALAVVDRERALALLERPPATLDFVRHTQVMRLATVVMALERS
jgi:hypothetical protein